jgi:L-seryl-tRNA(Ser) seleniumtransferase
VIGFTEDVGVKELKKLGKKYSLPVIYDMGNGLFADLKDYKIYEPTIADAMQAGADIMLFSGDKLLGGPQAGIIVGKKEYIERMKKHPLARVVRVDKMTLAALEAVFFEYQDVEKAKKTIPTLQMITASKEQLLEKAKLLQQKIALPVEIEPCEDFIGGGSAPDVRLEGYAVTIHAKNLSVEQIERKLRQNEIPIIAHRSQDKIWLHLRTLLEDDLEVVAKSIQTILRKDC